MTIEKGIRLWERGNFLFKEVPPLPIPLLFKKLPPAPYPMDRVRGEVFLWVFFLVGSLTCRYKIHISHVGVRTASDGCRYSYCTIPSGCKIKNFSDTNSESSPHRQVAQVVNNL